MTSTLKPEVLLALVSLFSLDVMRLPMLIKRWPIASSLLLLHTMILAVIYVMWSLSWKDPERDMIWLLMIFLDFPAIYAYDPLLSYFSIPVLPGGSVVFGGLEWLLVGVAFDMIARNCVRKHALRSTQNI
jgi:hypothetical protein